MSCIRIYRVLIVLSIMAGCYTTTYAQVVLKDKYHATFRKGITAAEQGDFNRAIDLFNQILSESPDHIDALTHLGVTYMESNQKLDSAIVLFNKVLRIIPPEDYFDPFGIYIHQVMARTFNLKHEPHKALSLLNSIKDSVHFNDLKEDIERDLKHTTNAIILLNNPIQLNILDLGPIINSEFDDHSPLVSFTGQKMYFTSRRPVGKDRVLPDGQYSENIFMSEHDGTTWQKPVLVEELYKQNEHLSILSLSPDGTQLFLYKPDGANSRNIYVSQLVQNKWQNPVKLPFPINSNWNETHASLSPDQSTLYFTSNRPGGFGGLDIYEIKKDVYGKWGEPVNLGANINSANDEETPMMHPDGKTLYFNSDGLLSMGGFDVLYSYKLTDGSWAKAVNLGYPINSADDDLFFLPTLDKSEAYLSSFRFTESKGRSNIYHVSFGDVPKGTLTVIEGAVENPDNRPIEQLRILVWRESDNLQIGEFRANQHSGKYLLVLNSDENYVLQEATPDDVRNIDTLFIPKELAYSQAKKIFMVEDIKMLSPLVPKLYTESLISVVHEPEEPDIIEKTQEIVVDAINNSVPGITKDRPPFTIQILALKKQSKPDKNFLEGLDHQQIKTFRGKDGYRRYVIGRFNKESEAKSYLNNIQKTGRFQDAWIREISILEQISY